MNKEEDIKKDIKTILEDHISGRYWKYKQQKKGIQRNHAERYKPRRSMQTLDLTPSLEKIKKRNHSLGNNIQIEDPFIKEDNKIIGESVYSGTSVLNRLETDFEQNDDFTIPNTVQPVPTNVPEYGKKSAFLSIANSKVRFRLNDKAKSILPVQMYKKIDKSSKSPPMVKRTIRTANGTKHGRRRVVASTKKTKKKKPNTFPQQLKKKNLFSMEDLYKQTKDETEQHVIRTSGSSVYQIHNFPKTRPSFFHVERKPRRKSSLPQNPKSTVIKMKSNKTAMKVEYKLGPPTSEVGDGMSVSTISDRRPLPQVQPENESHPLFLEEDSLLSSVEDDQHGTSFRSPRNQHYEYLDHLNYSLETTTPSSSSSTIGKKSASNFPLSLTIERKKKKKRQPSQTKTSTFEKELPKPNVNYFNRLQERHQARMRSTVKHRLSKVSSSLAFKKQTNTKKKSLRAEIKRKERYLSKRYASPISPPQKKKEPMEKLTTSIREALEQDFVDNVDPSSNMTLPGLASSFDDNVASSTKTKVKVEMPMNSVIPILPVSMAFKDVAPSSLSNSIRSSRGSLKKL